MSGPSPCSDAIRFISIKIGNPFTSFTADLSVPIHSGAVHEWRSQFCAHLLRWLGAEIVHVQWHWVISDGGRGAYHVYLHVFVRRDPSSLMDCQKGVENRRCVSVFELYLACLLLMNAILRSSCLLFVIHIQRKDQKRKVVNPKMEIHLPRVIRAVALRKGTPCD